MRITNAKLIKTVYEAKDLPPLDKRKLHSQEDQTLENLAF